MLIRPIAKRNGMTYSMIAMVIMIASVIILVVSNFSPFSIVVACSGLFIFASCLLVIGIRKLTDLSFRFSLTVQGIHYFTSRGGFTILWQHIQRIDIPTINDTTGRSQLPYVGIRLRQRNSLIDSASLPLLAHMLIEQRALILLAGAPTQLYGNADNMLYPNIKIEHNYSGLQAMFSNRMQFLHNSLGYDIFFPYDDLDRPPVQFVTLLRNLKNNPAQLDNID